MANYQICDLAEFMQTVDDGIDELMSHEQYLETIQPTVKETTEMPDDFTAISTEFNATNIAKEGEISQLLRITPGIIQPVHCFPPSYIPPKPLNQPDVILNDKIQILLHEKYFKFHIDEPKHHDDVANEMNNFDSITMVSDNTTRNEKRDEHVTTINDLTDCFSTVFCDSDEDNSNVQINSNNENYNTPKIINRERRQEQKYYNAREIYQNKRGNRLHNL